MNDRSLILLTRYKKGKEMPLIYKFLITAMLIYALFTVGIYILNNLNKPEPLEILIEFDDEPFNNINNLKVLYYEKGGD